ncbi:MAG TPA: aminoacyl-tRNA hydrolase [Patescibacteria group bacterium]|jgi:PTH1 family peptidyl-tRNA hydrolase|nr:aminoacyl-tRNA hydrolase [Patescibacteria group bacterium]
MENLYLIVGLGNPGAQYKRTRHNVGFVVLEILARRWRTDWSLEKKFNASLARAEREGRRVLLCQPQTFMNASGEAVRAVAGFYDVDPARILVVVDDADLSVGHLRLRPRGSSGGHHGLESIEEQLGTREYPRLRIGIGRREGAREITGHVLGRFDSTESPLVDKVLTVAASQAETWVTTGIQKAMNQFNGVVDDAMNEREDK